MNDAMRVQPPDRLLLIDPRPSLHHPCLDEACEAAAVASR
jgi:hypothetical protein